MTMSVAMTNSVTNKDFATQRNYPIQTVNPTGSFMDVQTILKAAVVRNVLIQAIAFANIIVAGGNADCLNCQRIV